MKKSFWLILILLVTIFSFSGTLNNAFINLDDQMYVFNNTLIQELNTEGVRKIFTSSINRMYNPLTILSFALEYYFFGPDPFIYHLVNLLLHLGVVVLIFLFALQIGISVVAAGLAALLFAIHPMHVESVAWVSERKDVLYALFYLLSMKCYWRYLEVHSRRSFIFSVFWGMLSVLAKPMALSLPLIFFVLDWYKGRKWNARVIFEKIPHFLYVIPITWLTYVQWIRNPIENIFKAALTWVWSFVFYVKQFIYPLDVNPFYQLPQPVSLTHRSYQISLLLFAAFALLLILGKRNRLFIFAWVFYFVSIFFLLRFDDVSYFGNFSFVADRFMYLPSLGFCLFFGDFFYKALRAIQVKSFFVYRVWCGFIAALFCLLSYGTFHQVNVWENSVQLWDKVIQRNPRLALAYSNRCDAYLAQKNYALAMRDCNQALELDSDTNFKAYHNRAHIYNIFGQYDLALKDFSDAIVIKPNADTYFSRGAVYQEKKEYELALEDYRQALNFQADYVRAFHNSGTAYRSLGKFDSAIESFNRVLEIDERLSITYYNRSQVFALKNDYLKALEDALKARSLGYQVDVKYIQGLNQLVRNP